MKDYKKSLNLLLVKRALNLKVLIHISNVDVGGKAFVMLVTLRIVYLHQRCLAPKVRIANANQESKNKVYTKALIFWGNA